MKKKIKSILKFFIALGLGLLIAYLSLKDLSPEARVEIFNSFKLANYWWIILSIFLGVCSHIIRAMRWQMLLKPMGYNPSLKSAFLSVMVGYFANLGIPRSGEVARCSILYNESKVPVDKSFGTVIIERSIDMIVFFGLFFFTFFIEYKRLHQYVGTNISPILKNKMSFFSYNNLFGIILICLVILIVLSLIIFRKKLIKITLFKKIASLFSGIWEGLKSVFKIKTPGLFILYSLLIWVFYFLMSYVCLFSLPQTSSLGVSAGLSMLVLGSIGIMVTPGGIGLYPVIIAQTLVLYGISAESGYGAAIGWLTWSAQTIMIVVVGALSLIIVSANKRKKNEPLPTNKK